MVRVVGVFVHLGGPTKFGNRAPRRVRSQAIAQTHQGPPNVGELRALALLPRERLPSAAVSWVTIEALQLSRPVVRGVNYQRRHTKARAAVQLTGLGTTTAEVGVSGSIFQQWQRVL